MCYLMRGCVRRVPKENPVCKFSKENYLDHFLFVDTKGDCEKL